MIALAVYLPSQQLTTFTPITCTSEQQLRNSMRVTYCFIQECNNDNPCFFYKKGHHRTGLLEYLILNSAMKTAHGYNKKLSTSIHSMLELTLAFPIRWVCT